MDADLVGYYGRRAAEYERIYARPERQADLGRLQAAVADGFRGRDVLEISCGTGFWTQSIAPVARSVVGLDLSPEVLEIARAKAWDAGRVEFMEADSYALPDLGRKFTAAFAGFWWSHVPRRRLGAFLTGLHSRLQHGATVMFIDNRHVAGSSTPVSRVDDHGDSFQNRRLDDGSIHEVLKNFPSEAELLGAVAGKASKPKVILTDYFWVLSYQAP
ncbi:MAG TPA: class I SAM-dependent methyltransferase [Opitutaceae bacterium]|jgi:demethylmenaquinone methyltransferase/2-methoxy-6-polyprenyl-1,4-benzoquinol methylase